MRILDVRGKSTAHIYKLVSQYPARFYREISTEHVHRETTEADIREFEKRAKKEGAVAIFIQEYGQAAYVPIRKPQGLPATQGKWRPEVEGHYKCTKCSWEGRLTWREFLKTIKTGCPKCGGTIKQAEIGLLPQTSHDSAIEKGRQYWNKVTDTQKAMMRGMGASRILEIHSDGDLTFEVQGRTYVLTTSGELFAHSGIKGGNGPGKLPQTSKEDDLLKYYKVPPDAY